MGNSLESSRPILAENNGTYRASARFSTYSAATLTPSIAPSHISSESANPNDPRAAEIKTWNAGFERLEDKRLSQQRYIVSTEQNEKMSKIALGAKLDRALGRRLTGQDAVFKARSNSTGQLNEKKDLN